MTTAAASGTPSATSGSGGSSSNIGALAGGITAGVLALGAAATAVYCAFFRPKRDGADLEAQNAQATRTPYPFADQLRTELGISAYAGFTTQEGAHFKDAAVRIGEAMAVGKVLEGDDLRNHAKWAALIIKDRGYIVKGELNILRMREYGLEKIASEALQFSKSPPSPPGP
jgi:hypothetical protein